MARLFREPAGSGKGSGAGGDSVALWAAVSELFGPEHAVPEPVGHLVVPKASAAPAAAGKVAPKLKKRRVRRRSAAGFTLVELLLVITIIAVLAALLMPTLSGAKTKAQAIRCLNNLRQLGVAAQAYMADHRGFLVANHRGDLAVATNSWVLGNMRSSSECTNVLLLRWSKLFPYASQLAVFHCPADRSTAGDGPGALAREPRVRSYAMNSWMGSRYMEDHPRRTGYRTFVKDSELGVAGASSLWMMVDEHESSIDDGWFLVTMDDSAPFASFPAARHQRGFGVTYLDGHADVQKLREGKTSWANAEHNRISSANEDWMRFKLMTTIR